MAKTDQFDAAVTAFKTSLDNLVSKFNEYDTAKQGLQAAQAASDATAASYSEAQASAASAKDALVKAASDLL